MPWLSKSLSAKLIVLVRSAWLGVVIAIALMLAVMAGLMLVGVLFGQGSALKSGAAIYLKLENGTCSATIVGPNTLLTASHCLVGVTQPYLIVNGIKMTIADHAWDGKDHSLIRLVEEFPTSSVSCFSDKLRISDRVYMVGNPGSLTHLYREGYFAGTRSNNNFFILPIWPGDSGSAIFNSDNQIVGVVSANIVFTDEFDHRRGVFQTAVSTNVQFTKSQLERFGISKRCAKNLLQLSN